MEAEDSGSWSGNSSFDRDVFLFFLFSALVIEPGASGMPVCSVPSLTGTRFAIPHMGWDGSTSLSALGTGLPFSAECLDWGDECQEAEARRPGIFIPAVSSPEIGASEGAVW